jgi:hypothetical protein
MSSSSLAAILLALLLGVVMLTAGAVVLVLSAARLPFAYVLSRGNALIDVLIQEAFPS